MSKLTRKEIDDTFISIKENMVYAMNKTEKVVIQFRYLIDNKAHEVLKCKETKLVRQIKCDENTESYLYRQYRKAHIESCLKLKSNSLLESWTRKIFTSANRLKLNDKKRKRFYKKVWYLAIKKAGGKSKVKIAHIKDALEYTTTLISKENELEDEHSKSLGSGTTEVKGNKKYVIEILNEIKLPPYKKRIRTIKNILSGDDSFQKMIKKLTTLNVVEQRDLIALIELDNDFEFKSN